jgi:hypothetical protein
VAPISQLRWVASLTERFRTHPAFVLPTENNAWGCSIWKAVLLLKMKWH